MNSNVLELILTIVFAILTVVGEDQCGNRRENRRSRNRRQGGRRKESRSHRAVAEVDTYYFETLYHPCDARCVGSGGVRQDRRIRQKTGRERKTGGRQ